jgi:hypothetical protein
MVGTLAGTTAYFSNGDHRPVSSHFGVGPKGIHQYVDLSDIAYGNGNVNVSGGWPLYTGQNPNAYTISIEHEDGGAINHGVVAEATIARSIELDRLLLTGSLTAIRVAGIRVREPATVTALRAIKPGPETLIDHHRISGKLKPFCWRAWLKDKGYPQARYIAALTGGTVTESASSEIARLGTAIQTISERYLPNVIKTKDKAGIAKWAKRLGEYSARLFALTSVAREAIVVTPKGAVLTAGESADDILTWAEIDAGYLKFRNDPGFHAADERPEQVALAAKLGVLREVTANGTFGAPGDEPNADYSAYTGVSADRTSLKLWVNGELVAEALGDGGGGVNPVVWAKEHGVTL